MHGSKQLSEIFSSSPKKTLIYKFIIRFNSTSGGTFKVYTLCAGASIRDLLPPIGQLEM